MSTELVMIKYTKRFVHGLLAGLEHHTAIAVDKSKVDEWIQWEKEQRVFNPVAGASQYTIHNVRLGDPDEQ